MPWTGHGHSIQHTAPPRLGTPLSVPIAEVLPGPDWDGTENSGFAVLPNDPARSTAKPGLRLITPDFQHFTEHLHVCVQAFALNTDTLIGGVDRVRFRFEGETVDVVEPSVQEIVDGNGETRSYWGYWARLRRPGNAQGVANLYIEAIPADATMQSRVIGPYSYTMADTLFPVDVTVNPDEALDPGVNYHDLQAAFAYVTGTNAENARITITKGGVYEGVIVSGLAYTAAPKGRIHLEASEPVTIGFATYQGDAQNEFDTRHPMWARGSNITFDMAQISHFEHDNRPGRAHVFDGVNFIDTANGIWRKGARSTPGICEGSAWFLECAAAGVYQPYRSALLVRGGLTVNGAGDVFPEALCTTDHTVSSWDNTGFWEERNALTVRGPVGATLELSGGNNASVRVLTAREDSAVISTFTIEGSDTAYFADTNYTVENVVDWLNSLPGWTASGNDAEHSRRANLLGLPGQKGTLFGPTDCGSADLQLVTTLDIHSDLFAYNANGENIIHHNVRAYQLQSQLFFLARTAGFEDTFLVNIAAENGPLPTGYSDYSSQFSRSHSHVVLAHCSLDQQLRLDTTRFYDPDGYCGVLNCAIQSISWIGTSDDDLSIINAAIDDGQTPPAGAIGTVVAGSAETKYVLSANGDFMPSGELRASENLRAPVVELDQNGQKRSSLSALGALR